MNSSNFAQALKELTGFDADERPDAAEDPEEWEPAPRHTYITSGVVITGEIRSGEDIVSEGRIFGDVTTTARFLNYNLMEGNLEAQEAELNGRFRGNVHIQGSLKVSAETLIIGDISCEDAVIGGKVKGNLDVSGEVLLKSNALIAGDITTDSIAAEPGARINGKMLTHSENADFEEEFDFGGAF